ncbi:MAG: flippase-like domain-containing protein [Clostridia bacterium]|nr:flippase-like domain-containing protein [Clostridia bacterium]
MKKSHVKQILNIGFVVLLALLTFILIKNNSDGLTWDAVVSFFSSCNPWMIVGAVGCLLIFIVFEGLALHLILRKFGQKPRLHQSLAYSTSDIYYSTITPSATGGQPASAFYMVRDGVSGGVAGFALVFNLVCYTGSVLLIGAVALIYNFNEFLGYEFWPKFLILLGLGMQIFLLIFFISCMIFHGAVLRVGNGLVGLLHKMHIIKNKEKWLGKVKNVVEKYKTSFESIKHHKGLMVQVFLCNLIQRAANIAITAFVCVSVSDLGFLELFMMQTLVTLGYNSFPLPGGSGAFEILFSSIYFGAFAAGVGDIPMVMTRVITYYLAMILCAIYTIVYHMVGGKRAASKEAAEPPVQEASINQDTPEDASSIPTENSTKEGM